MPGEACQRMVNLGCWLFSLEMVLTLVLLKSYVLWEKKWSKDSRDSGMSVKTSDSEICRSYEWLCKIFWKEFWVRWHTLFRPVKQRAWCILSGTLLRRQFWEECPGAQGVRDTSLCLHSVSSHSRLFHELSLWAVLKELLLESLQLSAPAPTPCVCCLVYQAHVKLWAILWTTPVSRV